VSHEYCTKLRPGHAGKSRVTALLARSDRTACALQTTRTKQLVGEIQSSVPGGGIDGDKLWLDQWEIFAAWDEDLSKNPITGSDKGEHDEEDESDAFFRGDLKDSPSHPSENRDNESNDLA
jgi:hypothetical protein